MITLDKLSKLKPKMWIPVRANSEILRWILRTGIWVGNGIWTADGIWKA